MFDKNIHSYNFIIMDMLGLLSSAFSAVTGLKIHPPTSMAGDGTCSSCGKIHGGGKSKSNSLQPAAAAASPSSAACFGKPYPRPGVDHVSVTDLVYLTYGMMQPSQASADIDDASSLCQLTVQMLKKKAQVTVEIQSNSTVQDLRKVAAEKLKLPPDQLMLIFNNEQLADDQVIKNLGLTSDSLIIGKKCVRGEELGKFELDPSSLDPKYDYDLTNQTKPSIGLSGQTFMRGRFPYERPYGWMRTALKVVDEYENNTWLGLDGIRADTATGEWPVSYHGTSKPNLRGIVQDGFKIGPRDRFGPAIYSSPSLENVARYDYASTFTHQGKTYRLALQNRVNPKHLTVYEPEKTCIPGFPYWLSPQQDPDHGIYHVRPYGILTREARATSGSWSDYLWSFFD